MLEWAELLELQEQQGPGLPDRAVEGTMMAGLGLCIWVRRGPASPSSLSQAAAILGWASRALNCLAQVGTGSERGPGPV